MGVVYCAKNLINGKCYVGNTIRGFFARKTSHEKDSVRGSKLAFHRALRKYGVDAFEWSILLDDVDLEDLNHFEIYFIRKLNSKIPNGYNMTDGGDGGRTLPIGWKHSKESKKKIGEKKLGKKPPNYGKPHSEKTRRKLSIAASNRSVEVRKRMSDAQKGKKLSAEGKAKFNFKGRKHTEESKTLMRISMREAWKKRKMRVIEGV